MPIQTSKKLIGDLGPDWRKTSITGLFDGLMKLSVCDPFIYYPQSLESSAAKLVCLKDRGWRVMSYEERKTWEHESPNTTTLFYPTPQLAIIAWKMTNDLS